MPNLGYDFVVESYAGSERAGFELAVQLNITTISKKNSKTNLLKTSQLELRAFPAAIYTIMVNSPGTIVLSVDPAA
jgi:hypothetical protein